MAQLVATPERGDALLVTCHCCGKVWKDDSRGLDAERRRCANRVSCITRALGPSPAKSYARKLGQSGRS